jgi:hypothetical protein
MAAGKKLLNRGIGFGASPSNILTGGLGAFEEVDEPTLTGALNLINLGFGFEAVANDIITQGLDPHGNVVPVAKSATDTATVASTEAKILRVFATDTDQIGVTEIVVDVVMADGPLYDADEQQLIVTDTAFVNKLTLVTETGNITGFDFLQGTQIPPSLYIPPETYATIDDVLLGRVGPLVYQVGLRYYDENRNIVEDIKDKVANVVMDWDETRSVKRTLAFDYYPIEIHDELDRKGYIEPYILYDRPQLYGGTKTITEEISFGLFTELAHTVSLDLTGVSISYVAHDFITKLVNTTVNTTYTVPTGSDYGDIIHDLCVAAGFDTLDIVLPTTPVLSPSPLLFEPGTTYYAIVEKLGSAVNWQGPYMGYDSKIYFREMENLSEVASDVTYATDEVSMILPVVSISHDVYNIVNTIIIQVDDPMRVPFKISYTNMNQLKP